MEEFTRAVEALRELGLSEYESRAYAVLVAVGKMTPREVSSAANIPYTKVYEVLKKLEARGWVIKVSNSPLVYAPRRPEAAIAELKNSLENKLRRAEEALSKLEKVGGGSIVPAGMYLIRSFDSLKQTIRRLVLEADELLVIASNVDILESIAPLLPRCESVRGVVEASLKVPRYGRWRRAHAMMPLDLMVADQQRLVLSFGPFSMQWRLSGVLVLDEEVAKVASNYFERLWSYAEEV